MPSRPPILSLLFGTAALFAAFGRAWYTPVPQGRSPAAQVVADTVGLARARPDGRSAAADSSERGRAYTGSRLIEEYVAAGRTRPVAGRCPRTLEVAHAIVVILPDPIDSHLDWAFDSGIESVRRALEHVGYVLDRYWLPWTPAGATRRDGAEPGQSVRARAPGVMLFRSGSERDELSVVYIVGETPTLGIHSVAFQAALDDRATVLACNPERAAATTDGARADTLRIVGPIFSGSARSLRRALDAWRLVDGTEHVSVVSGGATAPSNALVLRSCPDRPRAEAHAALPACADSGMSFYATVNSVDQLKRQVETAIQRKLGIPRHEIAYLTESGTQYGRSLLDDGEGPRQPSGGTAASKETATPAEKVDSALEIPFPMNISRLRREYTRQLMPTDTVTRGQPSSRTRLDWTDPASASESPGPLSELTAPIIERTLSDIEQTLLLHRVRAVGILATDVRDRLFLATVVKERLRDVKVFIIGSHSLYLRPELNQELRGTLVVSTYPLFLENQYWDLTHRERKRFVFTSDAAEGTFNAMLVQLGDSAAMTDYAYPLQSSPPFVAPVWITVVGANSMLPVTATADVLPPPGGGRPYILPRHSLVPRETAESIPSRSETAVLVVGLLAALGVALALHAPKTPTRVTTQVRTRVWPRVKTREAWQELLHQIAARARGVRDALLRPIPTPETNVGTTSQRRRSSGAASAPTTSRFDWGRHAATLLWHRESWALFRSVAIVCAFAPLVLVLFRPQVHGSVISGVALGFLGVMMTLAWLAVAVDGIVDGVALAGRVSYRGTSKLWQHVILHAIALAYLSLTAAFVFRVATLDPAPASMFFLRALALSSGVTPIVPLLAGALVLGWWCTWHLKRVSVLNDMSAFEAACWDGSIDASKVGPAGTITGAAAAVRPGAPEPSSALGSSAGFMNVAESIRRGLLDIFPRPHAYALALALALLAFWVIRRFDRSIEAVALEPLDLWPYTLASLAIGVRVPAWGDAPSAFDLLLRFLIFASIGLSVWGLYRLVLVWLSLRRCLRHVEALPLGAAFTRLPRPIAVLARFTPFNAPPDSAVNLAIDRAAHDRWLQLRAMSLDVPVAVRAHVPPKAHVLLPGKTPIPYPLLRSADGAFEWSIVEPLVSLHEQLCRAASDHDDVYLAYIRSDDSEPKAEEGAARTPGRRTRHAAALPRNAHGWVPLAQDIVALYVIDYVEWVVRHLRHLVVSLIGSLVLTMILLSSYPFEPESLIKVFFFFLMAASVAAIATMLFQMSRDPTMSRITHTAPGQVTWDTQLVLNLLLVAGLPLLTVVGAELPEVRGFFFSWVEPVLKAIGK